MDFDYPISLQVSILVINDNTGDLGTLTLKPGRVGRLLDKGDIEAAIEIARENLEPPIRIMAPQEAAAHEAEELGLGRISVLGLPTEWKEYNGSLTPMTANELFLNNLEDMRVALANYKDQDDTYGFDEMLENLEDAMGDLSGDALEAAETLRNEIRSALNG